MKRRFPFVLLLASLGGCTTFSALQGDIDATLDGYVQQQEYGRALQVFEFVPSDHPRHQHLLGRKAHIEMLANRYALQVEKEAGALESGDNWAGALELYRAARARLSGHPHLEKAYQTFLQHREARLAWLEQELLVLRGEALLRSLPLVEELVRTDAEAWAGRRRLERDRRDAQEVGQRLAPLAQRALEERRLKEAAHLADLAVRLAPGDETETLQRTIANLERKEEARVRASRAKVQARQRETESQSLRAAFSKAYSAGDYIEARRVLNRLRELVGEDKLRDDTARLREATATRIEALMSEGASLYSRGEFQEAIARWTEVTHLDPDHTQARDHIERAQRVVETLSRLRGSKAGTAP